MFANLDSIDNARSRVPILRVDQVCRPLATKAWGAYADRKAAITFNFIEFVR